MHSHTPDSHSNHDVPLDSTERTAPAHDQQLESIHAILECARSAQKQYKDVLQLRRRANLLTWDHFMEVLSSAYPKWDFLRKSETAQKLASFVERELEPREDIPQEQLIKTRQDMQSAVFALSSQLTDEQLSALLEQVHDTIPVDQRPSDFADFKAQYLAEWLAKGQLRWPSTPSEESAA